MISMIYPVFIPNYNNANKLPKPSAKPDPINKKTLSQLQMSGSHANPRRSHSSFAIRSGQLIFSTRSQKCDQS